MKKFKVFALLLLLSSFMLMETGCGTRRAGGGKHGCDCPGGF